MIDFMRSSDELILSQPQTTPTCSSVSRSSNSSARARASIAYRSIRIVSFWLLRKGMRGVGGRWNALRHRHDRRFLRPELSATVCGDVDWRPPFRSPYQVSTGDLLARLAGGLLELLVGAIR